MATFEQYENLPGVKVDYQDGNLYTSNQVSEAATESILLIGTAIDGPIGEPISVNAIGGPKAAEKLFGGVLEKIQIEENGEVKTVKVPHRGTLIRSMWEAVHAGNEDIRLLRIGGQVAKSEVEVKDANSEVTQPLADATGNQLIPGNIAFAVDLDLPENHRLLQVEKIEEFEGEDTTVEPLKTFEGSTGYDYVDPSQGSERVYLARDMFRPKNTLKITYKSSLRSYQEVTRSMNGVDDPSTLGLLVQDVSNTSYFISEVGNWSDDPRHQVLVYIQDKDGNAFTIPSVNANGDRLWRIGNGDPNVKNPLRDPISAVEYKTGGITFTSAYQEEVALGMYPSLDAGVTVTADYFYYHDNETIGSVETIVPGTEKVTFLNFIPIADTLDVYYDVNGKKTSLVAGEDFTIVYPTDNTERTQVLIKAGVGPVGARLFAYYQTGENAIEGAKLIIEAKHAGEIYARINPVTEELEGVKFTIEYGTNPDGTVDMEHRVIRFIKPEDKKLTSNDNELVFDTKNLKGVRTLREFANFVNGLPTNNIVNLEVPVHAGDVTVNGLVPTDYVVDENGRYIYRPINLGEVLNEGTGQFELFVDSSQPEDSPERYPWLGSNGFFDITKLEDTKRLYEILGGRYELVPGSLDQYQMVEQGIYEKLENYQVDIIDLKCAYANSAIGEYNDFGELVVSKDKSFATQLAQHCAMTTAKSYETIGVVSMAPSPFSTLREVQEYIDLATNRLNITDEIEEFYLQRGINPYYENSHFMYNVATHELIYNDESEPIDIGRYVNVVFGPEVGLGQERLGNYVSNGDTVYSALISTLNPEVATTNKVLPCNGLRYNLSEAQHSQLIAGRYVTFESRLNANGSRTVYVKDGITAAQPNSDYQRLSTLRITHTTVQLIRQRASKFIGLPNGIAQRNSLATEIQATLDRLKELGVLQNFKFSIFSSAKDRVLGNAFITLELVPEFETTKIYTSVALRANL